MSNYIAKLPAGECAQAFKASVADMNVGMCVHDVKTDPQPEIVYSMGEWQSDGSERSHYLPLISTGSFDASPAKKLVSQVLLANAYHDRRFLKAYRVLKATALEDNLDPTAENNRPAEEMQGVISRLEKVALEMPSTFQHWALFKIGANLLYLDGETMARSAIDILEKAVEHTRTDGAKFLIGEVILATYAWRELEGAQDTEWDTAIAEIWDEQARVIKDPRIVTALDYQILSLEKYYGGFGTFVRYAYERSFQRGTAPAEDSLRLVANELAWIESEGADYGEWEAGMWVRASYHLRAAQRIWSRVPDRAEDAYLIGQYAERAETIIREMYEEDNIGDPDFEDSLLADEYDDYFLQLNVRIGDVEESDLQSVNRKPRHTTGGQA